MKKGFSKRFLYVFVMSIMLTAFLTGCSSNDKNESEKTATETVAPAADNNTADNGGNDVLTTPHMLFVKPVISGIILTNDKVESILNFLVSNVSFPYGIVIYFSSYHVLSILMCFSCYEFSNTFFFIIITRSFINSFY